MHIRLVHAADLHLDTPFEGIAGPAPHIAAELQDASLKAWDDLVGLTLQHEAAALLLAGDVYDGAQRGLRSQLRVQHGLAELSRAGIQVFIAHGNHDPLDGWSAVRDWPPGVHVFGDSRVEVLPILHGGRAAAHVHGISYARRDVSENLALGFRRTADPGPQIGLLHANVGGVSDHAAYAPCTLHDLEHAGLDYWALGHIHKRAVLRAGQPWVVYPGNLQGRSPKPSETGPKGALIVDLDTETCHIQEPVFAALDHVRFITLPHDIAGAVDIPSLLATLESALWTMRDEHAGRGLLVRVFLEGRGEVVGDLRRAHALDDLTRDLRERCADASPFLWVERLVDRAATAIDPEAIRARGEFSAAVLARAEQLAADGEELAAFVARRGLLLDVGQVGSEVRTLPADAASDILAEALALTLDRLERAEGS